MSYLFPFAGDDRRRPKPVSKPKPKEPTRFPKNVAHKPEPVVVNPITSRSATPNMTAAMRAIAEDVCKRHKVSITDLVSTKRSYKLVHARREYVFRCRSNLGKSFPQIGRSINQDHTTAVHAYYTAAENPKKMEPFKRKTPHKRTKIPKPAPAPLERVKDIELSERQKIVYEYMLQGLSNRSIAAAMGRSYRQARNDTYEVRCKLKRMSDNGGDNAKQS